MISLSAVWGITLRHLLLWWHDVNLLLMGFYWPLLDILIWGFLGSWIAQSQTTAFQNYESVALMGILLWQIVGRGCNYMIISFVEELMSINIVNLFSLPLSIIEWMLGVMLFYAIMIVLTTGFCMGIVVIFYHVQPWYFVKTFALFAPSLFFSGLWLGFICLQIIATLGKRGIELGWVAGWGLLPFSGAYYPIEVLPSWAQWVSKALPMSHIFEGMRAYMMHQSDPTRFLLIGTSMGLLYALCSALFFVYCFNRTKVRGLARLVD